LGAIQALIHLANFVMPALGVSAIAALLAKLLWRRQLKAVPWLRLAGWPALAGMVVLAAGLAYFGHDGEMATYAALVLVTAGTLWQVGWGRR
jgi:hypothetical protein